MPATFFYDADVSPEPLQGKRIAVIGYGSQGHAHALNLRDSGLEVVVGLYAGAPSRERAGAAGLAVASVAEAVAGADVVSLQLPDERQPAVFASEIVPHLKPGAALVFSHGYNIRYAFLSPPEGVDVLLVAPLGPGPLVRSAYEAGRGVPCLFAVGQDASGRGRELALTYARAIGATRAGALESTFAEETETDLFGEQVVLCGGVAALVKGAFETLVEAGYAPEVAYICTLHELKQTVDLMQARGIAGMNALISNTAEYGEYVVGPAIVGEASRRAMREALDAVRSGRFAAAWDAENRSGLPFMAAQRAATAAHPIERVGAEMRARLGGKP